MTERRSEEAKPGKFDVTAKLISEGIEPLGDQFDTSAMSQGEPGLPERFSWRGESFRIVSCKSVWKRRGLDSTGSELYLRRHYYELLMEDGTTWIVYCLRQPPSSGSPKKRWFLYTISEVGAAD